VTKEIGGYLGPSHAHCFPKVTGSKFWNCHSVQLSRKPNNCVFENEVIPTVPGGGTARYKLWQSFTYSNDYYEMYRRLPRDFFALGSGWVGSVGLRRRIFLWRNSSWGKITSIKGMQHFLELFEKKHKKIIFFNWKYWAALKLKTNTKYYIYKGFRLLHNTLLFTLKYFY